MLCLCSYLQFRSDLDSCTENSEFDTSGFKR